MAEPVLYDVSHLVAADDVPTFYGHVLFEHYQEDGHLLVVTSDESALDLEPGDYVVRRLWSTAVAPYIHRFAPSSTPGEPS